MKFLYTSLIVLLFSIAGLAQARLGSTQQEIKREFWEAKYKYSRDVTDDGIPFSTITTNFSVVIYYFDQDGICTLTLILPDNQAYLNAYVENYNDRYVVVSNTEWKMYSKYGVCKIKLHFGEDAYYFSWMIEE